MRLQNAHAISENTDVYGAGTEFTDTVTLGSGLTITGQSIGVATTSQGFDGVDGIVGYALLILILAYVVLRAAVSRSISGCPASGRWT